MRVVKSISLPVDLAKKAESFDNLSLYVQDAIKFGIEHNLDTYQKSRLYLSKENQEMDDLLHEIVEIILSQKYFYISDKMKDIKNALVSAEWIVLNEEAKSWFKYLVFNVARNGIYHGLENGKRPHINT